MCGFDLFWGGEIEKGNSWGTKTMPGPKEPPFSSCRNCWESAGRDTLLKTPWLLCEEGFWKTPNMGLRFNIGRVMHSCAGLTWFYVIENGYLLRSINHTKAERTTVFSAEIVVMNLAITVCVNNMVVMWSECFGLLPSWVCVSSIYSVHISVQVWPDFW